jgi:hypothetical protein
MARPGETRLAGLETCDTAGLEVCATSTEETLLKVERIEILASRKTLHA